MRIIFCITNDIVTDQRVNRIAASLVNLPADILVVGISVAGSLELNGAMASHRIKMLFRRGPLFYAEYNLRLFFYLLFARADVIVANDLDTLPAAFLASRFGGKRLVYDSHEYFTELPELVKRKHVKRIWERIEAFLLPRIKYAYTVSPSIAGAYHQKYGIEMKVIRNLPVRLNHRPKVDTLRKKDEKLIIYQGAINIGRGLEAAIMSMQHLGNVRLLIAGSGYHEKFLRELVRRLRLHEKVHFLGRLRPDKLIEYTVQADLGISLEENMGLNYYYALPNKLFDYIQAGIPVLVSDLPEMANIVSTYRVGKITDTGNPAKIAETIKEMLENKSKREEWTDNLRKAAEELCWENEEKKLLDIYRKVVKAGGR